MEPEDHLSTSRSSVFSGSNGSVSTAGLTPQQPRRRVIQTTTSHSEPYRQINEPNYLSNDSAIPSHAIPIFLGILPYLLTVLFGNPDFWTEVSFFFTSLFWLWLSLKLPWDFYYYIRKSEKHKNQDFMEFFASMLLFITPFLTIYCLDVVQKYFYNTTTSGSGNSMFNNHIFLIVALLNPIKFFFTGRQPKTKKKRLPLESDLEEVPNPPVWAHQLQYKLDQLEARLNQELTGLQRDAKKPLQVESIPMRSIETMEDASQPSSEYFLFQKEIMQRFRVLEASILSNPINKQLNKAANFKDRREAYPTATTAASATARVSPTWASFQRLFACWKMLFYVSKQALLVLNYPWIAPVHLVWKKVLNKQTHPAASSSDKMMI